MWCPCFLLVVLISCAGPAAGYSNGKVSIACGDMTPQHGYESSPNPPPYSITVDKSTFSPGDRITVSLQVASSSSTHFKGFLIEARDAGRANSSAVGNFILVDLVKSQLLQCGHTQGSAVSHRDSSKKIQVQAVWESPKTPVGKVQFFVTVVQKYKVYWVRIAGPVVSVRGATAVPTTPAPTEAISPSALPTAISSAGCGITKSCLRDPVGCRPESDSTCFFLSFSTEEAHRSVMFELSGPAENFVSFALSMDKWMGNDDVYLCVSDGGRVTINAAYVSGRTHPEVALEGALWGRAWRLADGVIQCRFHRNILLPQLENRFSLNQSYFLFLAHGRAQHGFIYRHDRQPLISTNHKLITGPPEDLSGSRSPLLIKFHGVLMLTAWMWMVSTAVLITRHFKHLWSHTALLGHQLWFQVHRTMMVLVVGLTAVAFTLPFIYRGGWSKRAGSHPYIGCAVMALSVIQPVIAALRPAPHSPRRIFFKWFHFGTGTTGQVFAVVCIFLGVGQQALLLPSPWCPAVLTGWLLWIVLADLLLLIHSQRLKTTGHDGVEDKERILFAQLASQHHGELSTFKKIVLMVFLLGNTGFQAALVQAIINV